MQQEEEIRTRQANVEKHKPSKFTTGVKELPRQDRDASDGRHLTPHQMPAGRDPGSEYLKSGATLDHTPSTTMIHICYAQLSFHWLGSKQEFLMALPWPVQRSTKQWPRPTREQPSLASELRICWARTARPHSGSSGGEHTPPRKQLVLKTRNLAASQCGRSPTDGEAPRELLRTWAASRSSRGKSRRNSVIHSLAHSRSEGKW